MTERATYLPPWRIDVSAREGVAVLLPRLAQVSVLCRAIAVALEAAGAPRPASIGLILSDDAELARLNAAHLGKDGPTDVLSFPLLERAAFPDHNGAPTASPGDTARQAGPIPGFVLPPRARVHLGDIVVSVERAIEQADAGRGGWTGDVRWPPADELRLLVTHGVLHVCGWDHAESAEQAAMRRLERELLDRGSSTAGQSTGS